MKKRTFDILVIIFIAIVLSLLYEFNLLDGMANYALIPILAFYFLGQYSQRKFKETKD
jgi:di/tricarboxylate transporter